MSSILVVTVTLLFCTIGVESQVQVSCTNFSSNIHFRGDNIVLNRPVSHTPATYGGDVYNAELAADGNCDTNFVPKSQGSPTCTLTNWNNGTSPTWTVIFDKSYQITGIVIYNRVLTSTYRKRLGNFTVYGACDGAEKVVLYNDAGENKYQQEVILIEITDTHACSTISIQIPQSSVSGHVQYLTLCEVQVYTAVCSKPTNPFVTDISPDKPLYNKNASLTFQCNPGYRPSSSNRTVTCCGVDIFCPFGPDCERVYCQLPTQPDNGKYLSTSTNTSLEYGTNITGVCDTGYKTEILDTTRTCQQNGEWSGQDLVCTQIVCTPPTRVQHGYYTYTNNSEYNYINVAYSTNLTGHCNKGYNMKSQSQISCLLNESWIGNRPVCNLITCDPPVVTDNSYYVYNNIKGAYNGRIELFDARLLGQCHIGFKLKSHSELRCGQNSEWKGSLPVCEHITCERPLLKNGFYINTTSTLYYRDELIPVCDVGYSLKTNDKIMCNKNGEWSYKTATCVPINEGVLSTGMMVGILLGAIVVTVIITTMMVYIIMKKCRQINTKPSDMYGDLAVRNTSNEDTYSDLQNVQQN